MTVDFLYEFISKNKYAVLSTVTVDGLPESAVVGIAITTDLRIIFDTLSTSRKYQNLINNPSIAFVIGWDGEQTIQYEGTAKIPDEKELEELLQIYFNVFPDGKDRKENWKDIAYFSVSPRWIRYSDFNVPVTIEEIRF
ncbi:pyridoxamine 5'-phosphate oxidase family protein [Solitalea canadensis]|uniref:Putative stress protein (General stress protein 26) n=1 Tax=Solitalea canadensis (strain ATCC 29591 / DSM 3403 / JCM 21819 / LMG 8368 / NBRC 15130 / NCIMB 12057 / USAM 9D) TaxID=929556 RepID=H8KSI2_SOLCM|nr:pyridoxamine 5'-phosphate oxidase family protein [Solitalea canadensis]AFD08533.1 putative stress protein (general stress protein 26) [Solitalea canadensis DSM 3403]